MRFSDSDNELIEYFEKAGFTNGVRKLFKFYKSHQKAKSIETILDEKLMRFVSNFKVVSEEKETRGMSSKSKQFMNNLKGFAK